MDILDSSINEVAKLPSLVIDNQDRAKTWLVDMAEPQNWDDLSIQPASIEILDIQGSMALDPCKTMLQLAVAIQSHQIGIRSVEFHNCIIAELGHWCAIALLTKRESTNSSLLSLEFNDCDIQVSAALNISFMLQTNSIEGLSFQRCSLEPDGVNFIVDGLRVNQSLRELDCRSSAISLMQGIPDLLSVRLRTLAWA